MTSFSNRISLQSLFKMISVAGLIGIIILVTSEDLTLRTFAYQSLAEPTICTYQSIGLAGALRAFHSSKVIFLDARPSFVYDIGHIENAINVPVDIIASIHSELVAKIINAPKVVVYCDGSWCGLAGHEVELLAAKGITNTIVYSGGWEEWNSCKLPRTPTGS